MPIIGHRPWGVLCAHSVTQFRTLNAALDYNLAAIGSELMVWAAGKYRKALKRHSDRRLHRRVELAIARQSHAID